MADLVECPLCPWRISREDDEWKDAWVAHKRHHHEEGEPMPTCKVDGCDQDAAASRGPYALLCADHKAERQHAAPAVEPGNGHAELSLVELAQAVEQTRDAYQAALARLVEAAQNA